MQIYLIEEKFKNKNEARISLNNHIMIFGCRVRSLGGRPRSRDPIAHCRHHLPPSSTLSQCFP